jgi:hypothetical protein
MTQKKGLLQMPEPPRPLSQRKTDTLHRLEHDKDAWFASCDKEGDPYLVPLSFWWDGTCLFISTVQTNPTARNIMATRRARVALGLVRDVTVMDVSATTLHEDRLQDVGDSFKAKCGWDPRNTKTYKFFQLTPRRIEAWREENEHAERELMRDGTWLV